MIGRTALPSGSSEWIKLVQDPRWGSRGCSDVEPGGLSQQQRLTAFGHNQTKKGRRHIHNPAVSVTDVPHSAPGIVSRRIGQACPDGIFRDIAEGNEKLPKTVDDPALESVVPHMSFITEAPVEPQGKDRKNPLHDPRQALSLPGSDDEMEMVAHDTEVRDTEAISLPGPPDNIEKHLLHLLGGEDEFPAVRPGRNVVGDVFSNYSGFSHAL